MCVICVLPPNKTITQSEIENCSKTNPDGFGLVFTSPDGKFIARRTMKGRTQEKALISWAQKNRGDSDLILHWRIATHGGTNIQNCHPFPIGHNLYGAHNGMLNVLLDDAKDYRTTGRSDTRIFFEEYLSRLPLGWENEQYLIDLVEDYIAGSKIAVIDRKGRSTILRRKDGVEHAGLWFSNSSFRGYGATSRGGSYWKDADWPTSHPDYDDKDTSAAYAKGFIWDSKMRLYVRKGAKKLTDQEKADRKLIDLAATKKDSYVDYCILCDADITTDNDLCAVAFDTCLNCANSFGVCVGCNSEAGTIKDGVCSQCVDDWKNWGDASGGYLPKVMD